MDGKWENLFWQLPSSGNSTQLEVNTTKNLFKILTDSEREVEIAILNMIWQKAVGSKAPSINDISYTREYSDVPDEIVDDIFLIGISQHGRAFDPAHLAEVEKSGGQADGSILVETEDDNFQFIVEIKTGPDNLRKNQLGKYCNQFGIKPQNVATIQWSEIHKILMSLDPNHEVSQYLLMEFCDYLRQQNLDRKIALFEHDGYQKSIQLYTDNDGEPVVSFRARESGSSDRKVLTRDQYVGLFTEFFAALDLDSDDRHQIFIEGELTPFTEAVEKNVGVEIASTSIGFSKKARYRIQLDGHGSDGGLMKFQEMREDGGSAEFPNTYHFMLTEWELLKVVLPEDGPGFSRKVREKLLVDLQPEHCI